MSIVICYRGLIVVYFCCLFLQASVLVNEVFDLVNVVADPALLRSSESPIYLGHSILLAQLQLNGKKSYDGYQLSNCTTTI